MQNDPIDMALVWEAARADYLNGLTVAAVCERHGVGRSAFYARLGASQSVRRNHRFRDPPDDILIEAPECDPNTLRSSMTMAISAKRRADHALRLGRVHEVRAWLRVVADLRRMAIEEHGVQTWREAIWDRGARDEEAGTPMDDGWADAASPDIPDVPGLSGVAQPSAADQG